MNITTLKTQNSRVVYITKNKKTSLPKNILNFILFLVWLPWFFISLPWQLLRAYALVSNAFNINSSGDNIRGFTGIWHPGYSGLASLEGVLKRIGRN